MRAGLRMSSRLTVVGVETGSVGMKGGGEYDTWVNLNMGCVYEVEGRNVVI